MNLYRVETSGLGNFYVISSDFQKAAEVLKKRLDKADYGFFSYRKITSVTLLAKEEFYSFDGEKQIFNYDHEGCEVLVIDKGED